MPDALPPPPDALDETISAVCLACGLCCRGAIYTHVEIVGDEIPFAEGLGLTILLENGKTYFQEPPRCFQNQQCTIYEQRFGTCRTYQCQLLQKLRAGTIGRDKALEIVTDLRQRFDDIVEHLDPEAPPTNVRGMLVRELNALAGQSFASLSADTNHLLLQLRVVSMLIGRHLDGRFYKE